jgi:mRNA interferase HigB
VKVLNPRWLREYEAAHSDASASLRTWWQTAQTEDWGSFNDVRGTFNSADQVGERVIFNIKGGHYRLVTWVDYDPAPGDRGGSMTGHSAQPNLLYLPLSGMRRRGWGGGTIER